VAQSVSTNVKLDGGILVGADHYWAIIAGTVIRGDGPTDTTLLRTLNIQATPTTQEASRTEAMVFRHILL